MGAFLQETKDRPFLGGKFGKEILEVSSRKSFSLAFTPYD